MRDGCNVIQKRDTSLPNNYRPISLLRVAYKVLAALLLDRLKGGGREDRRRESQYSFRPERGTSDALLLVRRLIDAAREDRVGKLLLLLLDWSKAFDRIKTSSLLHALRWFGLPEGMLDMFGDIYNRCSFMVRDHNHLSQPHKQSAGIAQGCPLSPYLFIIVMNVIMADAAPQQSNAGAI